MTLIKNDQPFRLKKRTKKTNIYLPTYLNMYIRAKQINFFAGWVKHNSINKPIPSHNKLCKYNYEFLFSPQETYKYSNQPQKAPISKSNIV